MAAISIDAADIIAFGRLYLSNPGFKPFYPRNIEFVFFANQLPVYSWLYALHDSHEKKFCVAGES